MVFIHISMGEFFSNVDVVNSVSSDSRANTIGCQTEEDVGRTVVVHPAYGCIDGRVPFIGMKRGVPVGQENVVEVVL